MQQRFRALWRQYHSLPAVVTTVPFPAALLDLSSLDKESTMVKDSSGIFAFVGCDSMGNMSLASTLAELKDNN